MVPTKTVKESEMGFENISEPLLPNAPMILEDLDIPVSLAEDLILRRLFTKGTSSLLELSIAIKLSVPIVHSLFQSLRQKQLFEVTGMEGNDYQFRLSGTGWELAAKRFLISHYSGPAPVSLEAYTKVIRNQATNPVIDRTTLRKALYDLVLTKRFLDDLGPALASQKSIFLYGPTGNGKTSIAERLSRIYKDVVAVPYALEVDGQVVILYDPSTHERVDMHHDDHDPRWVLCRRPCIVVGAELDKNMLELQLEENTKVYVAPVHMRANNGVLVIDDFGRQVVSPNYLLNRWILPLDRRIDYLTLKYGLKFKIPFEMTVVFSTNLNPSDLADEAFLRRIPNKIYVDPVGPKKFDMIFNYIIKKRGLPCESKSAEYLRTLCLRLGARELRACQPKDILDILMSISAYEGQSPQVTPGSLERAASLYFAKPEEKLKQ